MEKMKNDDALTAMCAEMAEDYPEVMRPLLHDRNWYLAVRMWQWAQRSPEGRPLVAVIGKVRRGLLHIGILQRVALCIQHSALHRC